MPDTTTRGHTAPRIAAWILRGVAVLAALNIAVVALSGERSRSAYVVPAGILVVSAVSLRLRESFRLNAAALLLVCTPLPWGADIALGWFERQGYARAERIQRQHTSANGWAFDERTLPRAIEDAARTHGDAVPAMHPAAHLVDHGGANVSTLTGARGDELLPLAGIANVHTVTGPREGGRYFEFGADEHGFNNPPGMWDAPQLDIALVGDSFTHGIAVPSDSNLAAPVRRRWPLTLNLGYRGNGPLIELATLLEYLPQRRPRVVLWVVCEVNDIAEDMDREYRSALLRRYLEGGRPIQALEGRQREIDSVLRAELVRTQRPFSEPRLGRRVLSTLSLQRVRHAVEGAIRAPRDDWSRFADVLRVADGAVRGWGGTMYVVYLPVHLARHEPALLTMQRGAPSERRARILAIGDSLRIPVIDVETAFERAGERAREFVYPYRAHFTVAGYTAAGEEIVRQLSAAVK